MSTASAVSAILISFIECLITFAPHGEREKHVQRIYHRGQDIRQVGNGDEAEVGAGTCRILA